MTGTAPYLSFFIRKFRTLNAHEMDEKRDDNMLCLASPLTMLLLPSGALCSTITEQNNKYKTYRYEAAAGNRSIDVNNNKSLFRFMVCSSVRRFVALLDRHPLDIASMR